MTDNFQSKPVSKPPRDAKTVKIKSAKDDKVVSRSDVNAAALAFIKSYRKERDKNQQ